MDNKDKIIKYLNEKIYPFTLNERAKSKLSIIFEQYTYDVIIRSIDIAVIQYSRYKNGKITFNSVNNIVEKIGGIAHNLALPKIEKEINYILNSGKKSITNWNNFMAKRLLTKYVNALKPYWSDEMICKDLNNEVLDLLYEFKDYEMWESLIEKWIKDISDWNINESENNKLNDAIILPDNLFKKMNSNIKQIQMQINGTYQNGWYDCSAVMMRKLTEILLIETFCSNGMENEILHNGKFINLDKIIKKIDDNNLIKLTFSSIKNIKLIKDLGNLSSHKMFFNCQKSDIDDLKIFYRAMIEELIIKSNAS